MAALGFISVLLLLFFPFVTTSHGHAVALWAPPATLEAAFLRQNPKLPLTPSRLRRYANQSLSCEDDLSGTGSLNTLCSLKHSFFLPDEETFLVGNGSLEIHPNVSISCTNPGCSVSILLRGDLNVGANSTIRSSSLWIKAANVNLGDGAKLDSSEFGGQPPSGASGMPSGTDGAGAGHGGRGALCLRKNSKKKQNDVWGGDMYGWSSLMEPWHFGSSGGTTQENADLGGKGGGRVNVTAMGILVVDGSIEADGGSVGEEGGGGSGGSLFVQASRM